MVRENRNRQSRLVLAVGLVSLGLSAHALAGSDTWTGAVDTNYNNTGNWLGGVVPGVADGTYVSTDVATISGGPPADLGANPLPSTTIATDANRNILGITFENTNTQPFIIGSSAQALHLTGGGMTQVTATNQNNTTAGQTVNHVIGAPMVVHGNSYTFSNTYAATNMGLRPQGDITFTATGASVLTLDGTNATGINNGPTQVWSVLTDAAGGTTSVVKNGAGTWELRPDGNITGARPNTYSGDTVINAGILRYSGQGAGSLNSTVVINPTGRLQLSANLQSIGKVVLRSGGTLAASNSTTFTNLLVESGPALTLDYSNWITGALPGPTLGLNFTGTTAEQGGIKYVTGGVSLVSATLGGTTTPYNLGSVSRTIDVELSGLTTQSYDFRLRGAVSGSGGIVKTGTGKLRLEATLAAPWPLTGIVESRAGVINFSTSNMFLTPAGVTAIVNGGTIHVTGLQTQTFGSVVLKKGLLQASDGTSVVIASSFTCDVATGDTVTAQTVLSDVSGTPSPLVKNGAGLAILTGANTYTGTTTVNAGTLRLDTADADDVMLSVANTATTGGGDIKGGRIEFDYSGGATVAATVVPILDLGFDNGFTQGKLRSSNATASRGLGWIDDTANSKFIVAAALYGDANLDGTVNFDDLLKLASGYNGSGNWSQGDFNYDGTINFDDLLKLAANYNQTLSGSFGGDWALAQAVPEPTALALLGAAGLVSLRRKR